MRPNLPENKAFTLWVKELGFTWLGISLFSIVPAVLYGSAIFAAGTLAAAVLLGVPSIFIAAASKNRNKRAFRRLGVALAVPALTLAYVSHVDGRIPGNAAPLTQAIETFRHDTGRYPESLEALTPKYLAKLPDVRFSVFEPKITYRITDGKPYLAIPSAMGDMFAQFEYDFETGAWMRQS